MLQSTGTKFSKTAGHLLLCVHVSEDTNRAGSLEVAIATITCQSHSKSVTSSRQDVMYWPVDRKESNFRM